MKRKNVEKRGMLETRGPPESATDLTVGRGFAPNLEGFFPKTTSNLRTTPLVHKARWRIQANRTVLNGLTAPYYTSLLHRTKQANRTVLNS